MMRASQNCRPSIPKCCPDILNSIVSKCWHNDPEKRPDASIVDEMLRDAKKQYHSEEEEWDEKRAVKKIDHVHKRPSRDTLKHMQRTQYRRDLPRTFSPKNDRRKSH
eukprot:TRINITY_DN3622_c0_g1_i3.p1 TRINITY_DN3622_c0_g1~~TRINITY_DN3622_c0_g1_i3.p1  ORF type:complete len:107 (-),score=15.65 TRINITY_DN3622_c0_g1_i3:130-450(-)